jgi:hypothetical protein
MSNGPKAAIRLLNNAETALPGQLLIIFSRISLS